MSKPIFRLFYWPAMAGRGEYVRLMLEEAKIPYENITDINTLLNMGLGFHPGTKDKGPSDSFPCFAVPVLEHIESGFRVSQTPAICKYLGAKYGMYPEGAEDAAHADQLNLTIHDYILDGNLSYHMKDFHADYLDQKEYTDPYVEKFVAERLPKFLGHFEQALAYNKTNSGYLVGNKLTYVDLALLNALRVTEADFPDVWAKLGAVPRLKEF